MIVRAMGRAGAVSDLDRCTVTANYKQSGADDLDLRSRALSDVLDRGLVLKRGFTVLEGQLALVISSLGVAADQHVLSRSRRHGTAHLECVAPHQLRIVTDVFHPAGGAVVGEQAVTEVPLLSHPTIDHCFERVAPAGAGPEVLPLRLLLLGGMLESASAC